MYNTRSIYLKGQELMVNHVETMKPLTPTPRKKSPIVFPSGENWVGIKKDIGNAALHTRIFIAVI